MSKYKFVAEFADNTIYEQNDEDRSVTNPEKSCFFDVLEKENQTQLLRFHLSDNQNIYTVNLTNGRFMFNGAPFSILDNNDNIERLGLYNFRVIYFRRIFKNLTTGESVETYNIGWQASKPNGENVKQIIRIYS